MRYIAILMFILATAGCGPVAQPESNKTVAAFEVPLLMESDRITFLAVLSRLAEPEGMHVNFADAAEIAAISRIDGGTRTMHAAIYGDPNDTDPIATMMDWSARPGQVWLMFSRSENPERAERFRANAMREIKARWPETLSLPIMETGAIPLYEDLVKTPDGYVVNPSIAWRYTYERKQPPEQSQQRP